MALKSVSGEYYRIKTLLRANENGNDYTLAVKDLIERIIGDYHDVNDFVIVLNYELNSNGLDTFQVLTYNLI